MQGWHYGKGLIYAYKVSLSQSYTDHGPEAEILAII